MTIGQKIYASVKTVTRLSIGIVSLLTSGSLTQLNPLNWNVIHLFSLLIILTVTLVPPYFTINLLVGRPLCQCETLNAKVIKSCVSCHLGTFSVFFFPSDCVGLVHGSCLYLSTNLRCLQVFFIHQETQRTLHVVWNYLLHLISSPSVRMASLGRLSRSSWVQRRFGGPGNQLHCLHSSERWNFPFQFIKFISTTNTSKAEMITCRNSEIDWPCHTNDTMSQCRDSSHSDSHCLQLPSSSCFFAPFLCLYEWFPLVFSPVYMCSLCPHSSVCGFVSLAAPGNCSTSSLIHCLHSKVSFLI